MDVYLLLAVLFIDLVVAIFHYGSIILKEGEKRNFKK